MASQDSDPQNETPKVRHLGILPDLLFLLREPFLLPLLHYLVQGEIDFGSDCSSEEEDETVSEEGVPVGVPLSPSQLDKIKMVLTVRNLDDVQNELKAFQKIQDKLVKIRTQRQRKSSPSAPAQVGFSRLLIFSSFNPFLSGLGWDHFRL